MTVTPPRPPLTGAAAAAAFPLGGIGTGNVSIGARGELRDWEIFNGPARGTRLPFAFFAIHATPRGGEPVTRVLESRLRPPHERSTGYLPGDVAGLPRLRESRLRGEYPFVWVDFTDDALPVAVELEAFTPLVPLDAGASGLPAAVLRYRVRGTADVPVEVAVVGSLPNAVGYAGDPLGFMPEFVGEPGNEFRDDGVLRGLAFSSSLPDTDLRHGTMVLATSKEDVTCRPRWTGDDPVGAAEVWADLCAGGRLAPAADPPPPESPVVAAMATPPPSPRVGSLSAVATIAPGEEHVFEFLLAWHFPNRPKAWRGFIFPDEPNADQVVRNHYATRFPDAWAVARYLHDDLPRLEDGTRRFHSGLFGSTLPTEVVDAVAANIVPLRSTTCFWLADGTFAGWEGTLDHIGSCEGTCTHVWNYAQTAAFLFPELERAMRRVEFTLETDDDGRMNFRTNRIFDAPPWRTIAAVDGQLGTIVRLYREWRFSGDDEFLAELWPAAVRALEYALTQWDADGDLVLSGQAHNTYDIEFHGAEPLANGLFNAALLAAAELAGHLGEDERAKRYRHAAEHAADAMDRMLWNGEYYQQRIDDVDAHPYQYGAGCLSDQLLGQFLAHVTGLGHILPPARVRRALESVYRYNFRSELSGHHHVSRTYALDDEGGLLLCSWPHGDRPRRAFVYGDEVWTGVEYEVAAQLIYEGMVEEGLTVVRTARARHDGHRRDPWNEAEAGNHYVRSMASWALLLACGGFSYDAPRSAIGFAPSVGGDEFRSLFTTGHGWGTVEQDPASARFRLAAGSLPLARITVRPPRGHRPTEVTGGGCTLTVRATTPTDRGVELAIEPVVLAAGDTLEIRYGRENRS